MITIQKIPNEKNDKVRVTFALHAEDDCSWLYLVGWFDEWNESVYRMQRADDNIWYLTLELETGCEYHYCFRTSDGAWLYDPDTPRASYPCGSKNSFVISRADLYVT